MPQYLRYSLEPCHAFTVNNLLNPITLKVGDAYTLPPLTSKEYSER